MRLSVIIPAYNEEATLARVLERVRGTGLVHQIVLVDDGSRDATWQVAQEHAGPDLLVLRHDCNRGKGAAVRTALERCTGDIMLIQDADLEYDPEEYPALIAPIQAGQAQVVYGSRLLKTANQQGAPMFYWGGRLVTLATNLLFGSRITDEPTCYKVFSRQSLVGITLTRDDFAWEPEITAKLLKRGIAIHEVPISYHPRDAAHGKKIRPADGLKAIWTLVRFRFGN